jgi:hypothetical protein
LRWRGMSRCAQPAQSGGFHRRPVPDVQRMAASDQPLANCSAHPTRAQYSNLHVASLMYL